MQISLPNSLDNFLLQEMCDRLKSGHTVVMAFGGASMQPLISGHGEKVKLRPLADNEECQIGEVYLFFCEGHFIIHRLMRIEDGIHVFRGDNCYKHERVGRDGVLAKLVSIQRSDGTVIDCEGEWWHTMSKRVLRRKNVRQLAVRLFSSDSRRKLAVIYFILLAILMWAPLGGLGIALNNYIFGLRVDHLLHASVYLLCPLFLTDWLKKRPGKILLMAVCVGLFTEFVQMLLPYRGFDVNDLLANCVGNLLGWLAILLVLLRHKKNLDKKV